MMASSASAKVKDRILRNRSKSKTRLSERKTENVFKIDWGRSRSLDRSKEEKILNTDTTYCMFLNVSQAFEHIVDQLEIDDNYEEIYEKLCKTQSLINKKVSHFKDMITMKNNLKLDLESKNLDVNSAELKFDICLSDKGLFLEEFMKRVDCPFCLKSQADKVNLIKHLDENCEPHIKKNFERSSDSLPFSTFQILPNNTFKCNICPHSVIPNIKLYITHLNSKTHFFKYANAIKTKNYCEYLFCSCCKIQVANNYTQLDFHMKHEVHRINCINPSSTESFLRKGIFCVYTKSKKFKCLACPYPQSLCNTTKGILEHFEELRHVRNTEKKVNYLSVIYCEFCCQNVHIFQAINHFDGRHHRKKEKKSISEGSLELCFYCNFVCNDLMALSRHMELNCQGINEIKKKNLKESEDSNESDPEEENYIKVKNVTDVQNLRRYFANFGEITAIVMHKNKYVKITFREKKTVEDILSHRSMLEVEGVKLEIKTSRNFLRSSTAINRARLEDGNLNREKKNVLSNTVYEDEGNLDAVTKADDGNYLKNLFERVSSHLVNNTQKLKSEVEEKLVTDCIKALQVEKCDLVGFFGCGLSFSVESITLYCENVKNKFSYLDKTSKVDRSLIKECYIKMLDSKLWKILSLNNTDSSIKCVHKETQKTCTIIFDESAMTLTNMLRDCLKNNYFVRSFCIIIRFWLSVHELKIKDLEFTIISILVFFLISENIVNFPVEKYKITEFSLLEKLIEEKFKFKKPISSQAFKFDVRELFQKFLQFLDTFDFNKYAICLPIQHPIPKMLLKKDKVKLPLSSFSDEEIEDSSICILDPGLCRNLAQDVTEENKNSLLRIVRETIKHYKIQ